MTDKYAYLRAALPDLVEEARREGGTNPRAQMIINLLADYDEASARALHEGAVADAAMEDNKRLREIVEMMAAGDAEYDVLQAAAQAALAQEQGESDGSAPA